MSDRFVTGDTVTLSNTFKVSGTATTYTYAGSTITRTSTGLYTKNITASAAGLLVLGPTTDAIFFTVTPASGSALIYSYQFSYVIV